MCKGFIIVALSLVLLLPGSVATSQEHPEHPQEGEAQEHPEHPEDASAEPTFTVDEMAVAITNYVKKDTELKGGYFLVFDSKDEKALVLGLDKVHRERLSHIGGGVVFVCADFKTPEGKVYDLDVFMKGKDKDHLRVTEISVHKEDGVARYTWYEDEGVWKTKPSAK